MFKLILIKKKENYLLSTLLLSLISIFFPTSWNQSVPPTSPSTVVIEMIHIHSRRSLFPPWCRKLVKITFCNWSSSPCSCHSWISIGEAVSMFDSVQFQVRIDSRTYYALIKSRFFYLLWVVVTVLIRLESIYFYASLQVSLFWFYDPNK